MSWVQQLHNFSKQHSCPTESQSTLRRWLLRLSRILNALGSVCLEIDPHVNPLPQLPSMGSRGHCLPTSTGDISAELKDRLLEHFSDDVEMWAQLQSWYAIPVFCYIIRSQI
jgi:hypothetical protein